MTVDSAPRRTARPPVSRWRLLVVSALLIASATVLTTLYVTQYRVDRQTTPAAEEAVVEAVSEATEALLSYGPGTIDTDLSATGSLTTGEFATYYGKFTENVVAPAARERGVTAQARVIDSALIELHPDQAKVLVFLNQATTSRERPEPAVTASSVIVSATKVEGDWRISALDPV
ncbi:hypothetical protein [Mycolicibacterium vaccae]|uniref:Twin-arginine translocation pathway signal n=1 Tax=Mycolicibacterium vaccae ATCC 25954 TaxID=1194972 RepID=K0V266_MYCVA|nr:hypothetical protein [Mycolicibacterium vaccae]EJZ08943.1 hypothetical protein MVAC_13653 [Mycolicibacterium vaccae ATCC 25954]